MNTLVLDASAALNLCFEESPTVSEFLFEFLIDGEALVPMLWKLEISNALLTGERRGRLSRAESTHYWNLLTTLPINQLNDSPMGEMIGLQSLARDTGLSACDAEYLRLALQEGLALATADLKLRRACQDCGVKVYPENLVSKGVQT